MGVTDMQNHRENLLMVRRVLETLGSEETYNAMWAIGMVVFGTTTLACAVALYLN
jgi:hypothetical protein